MNRYLVPFHTQTIRHERYDAVIIGSGIAGVYTALQMDSRVRVAIVTKETLDISNSVLAQGGIAVSLDKEDSPKYHFQDTLFAGAGLCDQDTVWALVNEAAENIDTLCGYGVNFDREENHQLALSREAAHSKNRIIHTGDATGKEVCDTLIRAVLKCENVKIFERSFAIDILTKDEKCNGVLVYDEDGDECRVFASEIVICASGGFGQLYQYTTNPPVATGDGAAMAYRAGCKLMDLEFIQFHPTVLYHPKNNSFLISEAVRGEGAFLLNHSGKRFMQEYHQMAELAPRDVVSRAIFEEIQKTRSTHVYLDISHKEPEFVKNRFPTIYRTCLEYGIDITKDKIPVAPAEHYCMGGIKTDAYGRTGIKGFYACGESACNGIHGANRLASNSLLEGLVFGRRIGHEVSRIVQGQKTEPVFSVVKEGIPMKKSDPDIKAEELKVRLQKMMSHHVGIIRNEKRLMEAMEQVLAMKRIMEGKPLSSIDQWEFANMLTLSELVIKAALLRTESRGAHYRTDYPKTDDGNWKRNIIL